MIKGKVKIVSWPPVGAENVKPRFKIRGEYPVIEIGIGTAAILDDHNQVMWMNLEMLSFTEIGGEKLDTLSEFTEKNPEKSPEAVEKAANQQKADAEAAARDAAAKAEREAEEARKAEQDRAKAASDANRKKQEEVTAEPEPNVAAEASAPSEKAVGDEPAPE